MRQRSKKSVFTCIFLMVPGFSGHEEKTKIVEPAPRTSENTLRKIVLFKGNHSACHRDIMKDDEINNDGKYHRQERLMMSEIICHIPCKSANCFHVLTPLVNLTVLYHRVLCFQPNNPEIIQTILFNSSSRSLSSLQLSFCPDGIIFRDAWVQTR